MKKRKGYPDKALRMRLGEMEGFLERDDFDSDTFNILHLIIEEINNEEYKNKFYSLIHNYLSEKTNKLSSEITDENLTNMTRDELFEIKFKVAKCHFLIEFDEEFKELIESLENHIARF